MDGDQPDSAETTTYSLTYSLDDDRCLRRACPSCGREFKTEASDADLVSIIRPAFQQAGVEIGPASKPVETTATTELMHCPYCGCQSQVGDMLTRQFADYLERYVMREYVLPKLERALSDFSNGIGNSSFGRSGGLVSFSIKSAYSKSILPPRPICGPEPNDMSLVLMLCCARHIKVLEGCMGTIICPYCGRTAQLQ